MEEPRNVIVQKGADPLGISIVSGENGGVFVSKVTAGSIAHQASLEYGDQLLEVQHTSTRYLAVVYRFLSVSDKSLPFPV